MLECAVRGAHGLCTLCCKTELSLRLSALGSRLSAPGFWLPAPGSQLPAPGSQLPAPSPNLYTPKNAHNGQIGDRVQSAHTLSQPALLSLHQYDRVFFDS